ncbi:unnamed protein product [Prorocentrum cordatum]|uniref:Uncharacterized protein n=1 Tax=Prorocentrum cordatum TaxID=2364126 RepID=A0ABN9QMX7_9DINO|nr:unnamed protein product [Polarella glacialis]
MSASTDMKLSRFGGIAERWADWVHGCTWLEACTGLRGMGQVMAAADSADPSDVTTLGDHARAISFRRWHLGATWYNCRSLASPSAIATTDEAWRQSNAEGESRSGNR